MKGRSDGMGRKVRQIDITPRFADACPRPRPDFTDTLIDVSGYRTIQVPPPRRQDSPPGEGPTKEGDA